MRFVILARDIKENKYVRVSVCLLYRRRTSNLHFLTIELGYRPEFIFTMIVPEPIIIQPSHEAWNVPCCTLPVPLLALDADNRTTFLQGAAGTVQYLDLITLHVYFDI